MILDKSWNDPGMLSPLLLAPPPPSLCHLFHSACDKPRGWWHPGDTARHTDGPTPCVFICVCCFGFLVVFFWFFAFSTQGAIPKIAGNSFPCPSTGGGEEAALTSCFPKFQGMQSARAERKGRRVSVSPSASCLSLVRDGAGLGAAEDSWLDLGIFPACRT